MSSTITSIDKSLLARLDPDGKLNLAACLQCGRCSSGCTMRAETDVLPHQLNRMVLLGLEDELRGCKHIWTCVSCQTCVTRCPMKVDTPALIDRVRQDVSGFRDRETSLDVSGFRPHEALQDGAQPKSRNISAERVRIFNDALLGWVRRCGRNYELGLMAEYKLRARDLFSDLKKLPMMLRKGKLALLPPRTCGRKAIAKMFRDLAGRKAANITQTRNPETPG